MASSDGVQQERSKKQGYSKKTRNASPADTDNSAWSEWFDSNEGYEWRSCQKFNGTYEYQYRQDANLSKQAPNTIVDGATAPLASLTLVEHPVDSYVACGPNPDDRFQVPNNYTDGVAGASSQSPSFVGAGYSQNSSTSFPNHMTGMDNLIPQNTKKPIEPRFIRSDDSKSSVDRRDPRFKIEKKQKFRIGTVFRVIWQNSGNHSHSEDSDDGCEEVRVNAKGKNIFNRVRYFVVAQTMQGHSVCLAIKTYNGRATTKPMVRPQDHCIIYTKASRGKNPRPKEIEGEEELHKIPIRVEPLTQEYSLDPRSRLDYAQIYIVEHNVKVQIIGEIHKDSIKDFVDTYMAFRDESERVNDNQTTKGAEREAIYSPSRYAGAGFGAGFGFGVAGGVAGALLYAAADITYTR